MTFEDRGDAVLAALDGDELKLVYRVLHRHLSEHPELMETDFLMELQNYLQRRARAAGVDISDHARWDEWVGHAPRACEARRRGPIRE
jgi:hypothetical protein